MPADRDDDLAREIRAHLELEAEERVAEGASPADARDAARRAFGNVMLIREDARSVWTPVWIDHLQQDLRYAVRTLAKSPGFTLVAVVTLALGIGANTAIFTVVNAVLLRPLPFADSDRVVRIVEHLPPSDGAGSSRRRVLGLTSSEVAAFASQTTTLSHVGTHIPTIRTVTSRDEPVRLVGARLSPALLSMIATRPLLGRLFDSHEDGPGAEPVVILSHASWQRYFAADPNIVGQRLGMDGTTYTVVGVMDRGFAFPDPQDQFWMPLPTSSPIARQRLPAIARLKDGVPAAVARAEIEAIVTRLRRDSSVPPQGSGRFEVVRLVDLMVEPVKTPLLVLTAAVGLVLLIACVNVANLLLARGAARQREMAVRFALGAGRGRLIRQALTESMALAVVGGASGAALAFGGIALLRSLAASLPRRDLPPGISFPRLEEIAVDPSVLALTLAASIITGVVFGLIPAVRQSRPHLTDALRQGTAPAVSGFNLLRSHRLQGLLVVAEIAMATTLFVGGALLLRSFVRLSQVSPGYDPNDVLTFQLAVAPSRTDAQLRAVAENLVERIQRLPGVGAVGYAESLPMTRVSRRLVPLRTTPEIRSPRRPPGGPTTPENPDTQLVSRGFLTAMALPLVAGRTFGDNDRAGQPQVMLINRTLARSGLLGEDPLGRQIYALGHAPWEVVGIVEDVRQSSLLESPVPQIFIDYRQVPDDEQMAGVGLYFSIRTDADPGVLAAPIRALVSELDSQAMVENIAPMNQLVSNSLSRPRLYAVLLGIFAGVAVALAATGIYGVMAYAVTQRTREIGIRVALGAARARVIGLVLGQSAIVTVIGIVLGLGGAAALTRYLDQALFGLTALDPGTFAGVGILFAAIATMAAVIPARRATKVDPLVALRFE
jgi:putative ABC transport system permease protein